MNSPFKIIIDSRAASEGTSDAFSFMLPEVTHIGKDTVCYVNQASVTNSFLTTGTYVGSKNHYFYWIERIAGNATIFNRAPLPEQNYDAETLAETLSTVINTASWFGDNQYTVVYNESKTQ